MMEQVPMDVFPLIDRSKMPQIDAKYYNDMFVFLGTKGYTFTAGYIDPQLLRLHQEVDVARAMQLPDHILKKPILLSDDNYVLDGDHRGYRHAIDKTMAAFIRIETSFAEAYKALLSFPETYEVKTEEKNVQTSMLR